MTARFARRLDVMKASEIRELLKITQRPEVISFAGGLPAPELFPVADLKEVAADVLEREGTKALQYSTTEGHPGLREQIVRRMNRDLGTTYAASQILVTSGSQQGLDLTGKLFLDEGDEVLCESPTYIGAINAFRAYQPRFVDVPTDDDGMIPEELERCIAGARRPKYIYAIPTFQNPTGRTWTVERRRAVLEVAARHGLVVIEDDPYGQLCFEGTTPPALASLAKDVPVVYLGTFSKVFCPGMRIGWLAAPPSSTRSTCWPSRASTSTPRPWASTSCSPTSSVSTSTPASPASATSTGGGATPCCAAMETEFPAGVSWTRPRGGLFLWVTLPEAVSARDALGPALEQNVAFVPGGSFFPNGGHENTMRLNYSNMPEERITEGIRRLGAVLRGLCAARHPPLVGRRGLEPETPATPRARRPVPGASLVLSTLPRATSPQRGPGRPPGSSLPTRTSARNRVATSDEYLVLPHQQQQQHLDPVSSEQPQRQHREQWQGETRHRPQRLLRGEPGIHS